MNEVSFLSYDKIKYFITETNATISVYEYNFLSDSQKSKCNPIYK